MQVTSPTNRPPMPPERRAGLFADGFGDASVPADMRALSEWFCTRFDVRGVCDPMYVANVAAVELQIGNGRGEFTGEAPKGGAEALWRLARRLHYAYATCVQAAHPGISDQDLEKGLADALRGPYLI